MNLIFVSTNAITTVMLICNSISKKANTCVQYILWSGNVIKLPNPSVAR